MREVHYFIPRNYKELKSLVGKSVAINRDIGKAVPMILYGFDDDVYEFIRQETTYFLRGRTTNIESLTMTQENIDPSCFEYESLYLRSPGFLGRASFHVNIYIPGSKFYDERLAVLQQHIDMWHEPRRRLRMLRRRRK